MTQIKRQRWFAWRPVITVDYKVVWFRNVYRTSYVQLMIDPETNLTYEFDAWEYEL